jgi:hypothetical protein
MALLVMFTGTVYFKMYETKANRTTVRNVHLQNNLLNNKNNNNNNNKINKLLWVSYTTAYFDLDRSSSGGPKTNK